MALPIGAEPGESPGGWVGGIIVFMEREMIKHDVSPDLENSVSVELDKNTKVFIAPGDCALSVSFSYDDFGKHRCRVVRLDPFVLAKSGLRLMVGKIKE
jgi:hypothetical protein